METTQHTPANVRGRIIRASILPIEDEETMIAGLRAGAEAVERGELDAEDFAGIWSQYLRELFRRASSVPAPADVPERVEEPTQALSNGDDPAALLRTPRGEGEGDTLWRDFEAALVEFEAAAIALGRREALPLGPREAAIDRVVQARRRVIACAHALAALRSEAQGEEADALDLIRWAEARAAVLEPVVGNLTPPGTYACYVEGVGDDPAEYEDAGEPYMGPGILGAIRVAHLTDRSESDGE